MLVHELESAFVQAGGAGVGVGGVWCSGAVVYYFDAAVGAVGLAGFSAVGALGHFAHG